MSVSGTAWVDVYAQDQLTGADIALGDMKLAVWRLDEGRVVLALYPPNVERPLLVDAESLERAVRAIRVIGERDAAGGEE